MLDCRKNNKKVKIIYIGLRNVNAREIKTLR